MMSTAVAARADPCIVGGGVGVAFVSSSSSSSLFFFLLDTAICLSVSLSLFTAHTPTSTHIHTYIYMYIQTETEREREREICLNCTYFPPSHTHIHTDRLFSFLLLSLVSRTLHVWRQLWDPVPLSLS